MKITEMRIGHQVVCTLPSAQRLQSTCVVVGTVTGITEAKPRTNCVMRIDYPMARQGEMVTFYSSDVVLCAPVKKEEEGNSIGLYDLLVACTREIVRIRGIVENLQREYQMLASCFAESVVEED